jgi:hypothetical protein
MKRMAKRVKKGVKKGAKKGYCEQPYYLRGIFTFLYHPTKRSVVVSVKSGVLEVQNRYLAIFPHVIATTSYSRNGIPFLHNHPKQWLERRATRKTSLKLNATKSTNPR